ncbi:unnamed protein product, partial [Cuscuta europaea]
MFYYRSRRVLTLVKPQLPSFCELRRTRFLLPPSIVRLFFFFCFARLSGGKRMLGLRWPMVVHGRKMDDWSSTAKEAGTDLDSMSFVIGGDRGDTADHSPPEPPSWSARESKIWKPLFNFTVC